MDAIVLEGFISVKEAILAGNREISGVFIDGKKRTKKSSYMKKICTQNNIKVSFINTEAINQMTKGKTHGGFVCLASERKFCCEEQFLSDLNEQSLVILLEGIEDPYNFGYAIRCMKAFGVDALIVSSRDWSTMSSSVSKSSSGMYENFNILRTESPSELIARMKDKGFNIVAAQKTADSKELTSYKFGPKTLLVIGGEKRGISKDVISCLDESLLIPYNSDFKYSLTMSNSISVLSYEYMRQVK